MTGRFIGVCCLLMLLSPQRGEAQRNSRELIGHSAGVYSAQYSSSGRFIVTAGFDQTVRLWDAASFAPMTTYEGHTGIVLTAVISPGEDLVASGAIDNSIRLWDLPQTAPLKQFAAHADGLTAFALSFDGTLAVSAGKDGTLRLHDLKDDQVRAEITRSGSPVLHVAIRRDNQQFAVGAEDGSVSIYACDGGRLITLVGAHRGPLAGMEYSPNNAFLVTAGEDGYLRRFPGTLPESLSFEAASAKFVAAALDESGNQLATAGDDNSVQLWDVAQGKVTRTLSEHARPARAVAYSPNGALLATGGDEKILRLFQISNGQLQSEFKDLPANIAALAYRPDNQTIAVATDAGQILLVQISDGAIVKSIPGHAGGTQQIGWSSDGKVLASAGADQRVRFWDPEQGTQSSEFDPAAPIAAFALAPKGDEFAVASPEGAVRVFAVGKSEPKVVCFVHAKSVVSLDFSNDAAFLATASVDGTAICWELKNPVPQQSFVQNGEPLRWVAFRPDNSILSIGAGTSIVSQKPSVQLVVPTTKQIPSALAIAGSSAEVAVGTQSGEILTYNLNNGEPARGFSPLEGKIRALAYLPSNSHFAAAGANKSVAIWRISNRQRERDIHTPAEIDRLAFSPDSKKLVVAGRDRVLRSYHAVATNSSSARKAITPAIQEFVPTDGDAVGLGLPSDNRTAVTATADGLIRLWSLASPDALATLTGHSGQIYGLAFNADGSQLASVSSDRTLRLWSSAERKVVKTIATLDNVLYAVAFEAEGKSIFVAGANRILRRIDIETGRTLQTYEGGGDTLYTLALSRDGKKLAAAGTGLGASRTIWIWSVDNPQPEGTLSIETDSVYRLEFNADGDRLLAVGYNGRARIFDLSSKAIVHEIDLPAVMYSGAFSPDGTRVLISTGANSAIEYDLPEAAR